MKRREAIKKCLISTFFTYETPKVVQIESKCVGGVHKFLLLSLSVALMVYVFVIHNGHQYIDQGARTSSTCKVKGVAYNNWTDAPLGKRVWDAADLYGHPVGDGSFFITTKLISTHGQQQEICAEEKNIGANCESDDDCEEGKRYNIGHGVDIGKCNKSSGTCMVKSWCPLENDKSPDEGNLVILEDAKNFTVFIKNHVYFPFYKTTRSNLIESINHTYLGSCVYHPEYHPYCPIFKIGDIVSLATAADGFNSTSIKGAVISISIVWDCNLDLPATHCKPKYEFHRLDKFGGNDIATGYNFRYSSVHKESGMTSRTLYKAYGMLFLVNTEAVARAFDLQTFLLSLGSSLALLGLAPFIAEFILFYAHRKRKAFKKTIHEPKPAVEELMRRATAIQLMRSTSVNGVRVVDDKSGVSPVHV